MGAGGGSIAWLDGQVLKVGPRSAGSKPGPACYGAGGTEPTLTDAYLLCNYLAPRGLLGGRVPLRRELAELAMAPIAASGGDAGQEIASLVDELRRLGWVPAKPKGRRKQLVSSV